MQQMELYLGALHALWRGTQSGSSSEVYTFCHAELTLLQVGHWQLIEHSPYHRGYLIQGWAHA